MYFVFSKRLTQDVFYYEHILKYKNTHSFEIVNFFLINCYVNEQ